ncbi:thiolase family protein [Candidatus Poriferisocius sp.]|uniref:thiolase family protein n=1 Tax=Candidatus Poriferisocius sp. TaxID=3101276 RepID=UPI003B01BFEE
MTHPFAGVVLCAGFNTTQARKLEGHTSVSIALEAAVGALTVAGVEAAEVDGVFGDVAPHVVFEFGLGPVLVRRELAGIGTVAAAAAAIGAGLVDVTLVVAGDADVYRDRSATAPWTRPAHEFVEPFGLYTAVEFALTARRHMEMFGTKPEHLATVAATIRNNGHVNPDAVYSGRGPFTADDVLASPMVAEPFHVLDCAMTSEGGSALVMMRADRVSDLDHPAVYIHGVSGDTLGPGYHTGPAWDLRGWNGDDTPNGWLGARAANRAFAQAGLRPADVAVAELYDAFSFEVIRQLEAFGFCRPGEAVDFVMSGEIGAGGSLPVATDGGLMSYSHPGSSQMLQRVVRAMHQIQGSCRSNQVDNVDIALAANAGAGALSCEVMILGGHRP